jgi:general secretion pathway protein N
VKRAIWIALLALVAFAVILAARMPAAWVVPAHSARGACASIDGSLLSGTCLGLIVGGTPVGDVTWQLHPARLLVGRLAAHVEVTRAAATARAELELGFGERVTLRNLVAELPLDPALISALPASVSGRAHLDLALARIEHGVITELIGRIEARDLEDRSGADTVLGSYVVSFGGGPGAPTGRLRDLDGPFAVEGTLRLTPEPGFDLEGLVATRPGAPAELVNNIRFLGSPDASGRRSFSVAGTF